MDGKAAGAGRAARVEAAQGHEQTAGCPAHLIEEQRDALRDLISTMPALSLTECAVQLDLVCLLATSVGGQSDDEKRERLSWASERIMISVVPVIAEAAGLDPAEF